MWWWYHLPTSYRTECRCKACVSGIMNRQCLLHQPGFQHLIAAALAAPVVSFFSSIYYLSSWHRCPNPNSNRKVLEKKKDYVVRLRSSATYAKCVQHESIPESSVWQASVLTTTLPLYQVFAFDLSKCGI